MQCGETSLMFGGTVCQHQDGSWIVNIKECKLDPCDTEGEQTNVDRTMGRCTRRVPVADAQKALLVVLNDMDLPRYTKLHTLHGSEGRMASYMSSFIVGFLSSLSAEEMEVRNRCGLTRVPKDLSAALKDTLMQQYIKSVMDMDANVSQWHPTERKLIDAMDDALAEGLAIAALREAVHVGWQPWLLRHLKLRVVLGDLKNNEFQTEYHEQQKDGDSRLRYREQRVVAGAAKGKEYEQDSLGYGSTYLTTVFRLLFSRGVQQHWEVAVRDPAERTVISKMVVFGSNLGWQCFFGALLFAVEVDGYEIVQHRYDASVEFARKHGMEKEVQFFLQDATEADADWSKVGLVYMTDLLWNVDTCIAAMTHVAKHAVPGTVCVTNKNSGSLLDKLGFSLVSELKMPASWQNSQEFYVTRLMGNLDKALWDMKRWTSEGEEGKLADEL